MGTSFFIDSDVILDLLLKRKPFDADSLSIFKLAISGEIRLSCSSIILTNVHFFLRKAFGKEIALIGIEDLMSKCTTLPVGESEIRQAISSRFYDFEDAIQYFTALTNPEISGIITRNTSDYKHSDLPIYSPDSFLALFK
ncbi:PIN domain-containing protein [Algoriphagus aquimarinus]|uniref:type II toxin-antitoxin system VapC family toxin n=1 Tax=Algoriphagus aquimarinus TaxID=237018 RepID=UPI0030DA5787|tara:strand:- start:4836 stop:5255 length:420 start_codon:yes stop_codon:yes gene_type:complete